VWDTRKQGEKLMQKGSGAPVLKLKNSPGGGSQEQGGKLG